MSNEGKEKVKVTVEAFGETIVIEREAVFFAGLDDNDGNLKITSGLLGSASASSMGRAIADAVHKQDAELEVDLAGEVAKTLAVFALKDLLENMAGPDERDAEVG